jgi:predicted amidohydrolase YtcJ
MAWRRASSLIGWIVSALLTVASANITKIPTNTIQNVTVLRTFVGGRQVYEAVPGTAQSGH